LKKEENQQASIINISKDKIVGCCGCNLIKNESKTTHDALNSLKIPMKYEKFKMSRPSKFNDEMTINIPVLKNAHVTTASTKSLQRIQTPIKSIENIEMKDSTLNRNESVYLILFRI
jgi:hypothetical protein